MKNFYEVLQVRSNATQMQIKKAYIELITKYHPDIYRGDKDFAQKYTALITEAYSVLKDVDKRRDYDIKHGFATTPNYRQLRREDRQVVRERRRYNKEQNIDQEISRAYFKNAERKPTKRKSRLIKMFTSRLFYAVLTLIVVEVVVAVIVYFK